MISRRMLMSLPMLLPLAGTAHAQSLRPVAVA
jgi:hypothetical protein